MLRVPVVQTPDWFRVAAGAINGWLSGKFTPQAAPPSPTRGQVYYDETTNKLRVYTNAGWVDLH